MRRHPLDIPPCRLPDGSRIFYLNGELIFEDRKGNQASFNLSYWHLLISSISETIHSVAHWAAEDPEAIAYYKDLENNHETG